MIPGYAPLPDDRRSNDRFVQRRRVALALVITVLAVIVSIATRENDASSSSEAAGNATPASVNDSLSAEPAFLPGNAVAGAPDIITVNVPTPPAGTVISGRASYVRWPQTLGLTPCATPHALIGARITVTNLNNARSIVCDNVSIESLGGGNTIIVHTDAFLEIADLVDAPIPVEIQF